MGLSLALGNLSVRIPTVLYGHGSPLGIHDPVAILEVRAGSSSIRSGIGQHTTQQRAGDFRPWVELRVAFAQQRSVPSYRGAGHAGAIHHAIRIARQGAVNLNPLSADRGEHTSVILRSPGAKAAHHPIGIHSPHVDRILRPIGGRPIALSPPEIGQLSPAIPPIVPCCEYVGKGGNSRHDKVEITVGCGIGEFR